MSKQPMENMMNAWHCLRNGIYGGLTMSQVVLV